MRSAALHCSIALQLFMGTDRPVAAFGGARRAKGTAEAKPALHVDSAESPDSRREHQGSMTA